jgi:hypothetical protein
MCHYQDILGGGDILFAQLLVVLSIIISILFWAWIYRRYGVALRPYLVPLAIWIVFGTLDIVITVKGTFTDPTREGNPLAQLVFVNIGYLGPVVASVLWIGLWSLIVLAVNKKITKQVALASISFPLAQSLSLTVFYSLAVGHIRGFSSWFMPLCAISEFVYGLLPGILERFIAIVFVGIALAALHTAIASIWVYDNKRK